MMKDYGLVSIIIPVYNVEKYLPECLDSVCGQTYRNLEILVIDDGSPDNCGAIADGYALRDDRFKVFHIKNRGAAGARNVGLDLCRGRYLFFVDSDDWIEPRTIELMLCKLEEEKADIVMCQFYDEYRESSVLHSIAEKECVYDNVSAMREYIDNWEYPLLWNKIYRASILGETRLVEGRCIDDEFFTYHLFSGSKKTVLLPDPLYHYRQRRSSAMGNPEKRRQRARDQIDFVTKRYYELKDSFPSLKPRLSEHMCEVYMHVMRESKDIPETYGDALKHLRKHGMRALFMPIDVNMKKSILSYMLCGCRGCEQDTYQAESFEFYD